MPYKLVNIIKYCKLGGNIMDKNFYKYAQIKLRGTTKVDNMEFHEIEGGFGENKKSMLVKEIAHIHGRELGKINELINNNKLRFKDGIDILDLKGGQFDILLKDNGIYTQNALNVSKNIYLLSERGYAKLLKLLEDDVAWEQYEKLVDGYFNMRQALKYSELSPELQAIFAIDGKQQEIDNRVTKLENIMTIDYSQQEELRTLGTRKVVAILGGKGTPAYKELNKKAFSSLWRDYKRVMDVNSYKNTAVKNFEEGRHMIINWEPDRELQLMIKGANSCM